MKTASVVLISLALACEGGSSLSGPELSRAEGSLSVGQPATPIPVTGTFTLTFEPVAVRQANGNTFIDFTLREELFGSFAGTRVGTGTLVIHADGSFNDRDSGLFTGTVTGVPGSVKFDVRAQGTFASFAGTVTVYANSGTGGLTGLQGVIKVSGAATGPATVAGSYEGHVHF